LVGAIAEHQRRFWGLELDGDSEITICSGATEAIFVTLQALCEVGDEVIIFEPFYDSYRASIAMAGAVERVVTLRAPDFRFDPAELAAAFTQKTRAILINTPHNPTGKVFSRQELETIAALCRRHDVLAITDEVYEHLVYEGEHLSLATFEGMRERTVTISSAGKSFSFTGWKVGYACAIPPITQAIRAAHQFVTFCNSTPFQHALVSAYRAPEEFFTTTLAEYRERRDRLCAGLAAIGFEVLVPAGTYFVLTDIRPLGFSDDLEFCRMLPREVGVAAVPPTAFYRHPEEGRHLVRWAFCKSRPVLDEALSRLSRLKGR
jgi:N-succinyldiaminopimelate aminotransferase